MNEGFGGLLSLASTCFGGNDPLPGETCIGVEPSHFDGRLNARS
jgi:hypothetical protein